jgi:hypothetical protein
MSILSRCAVIPDALICIPVNDAIVPPPSDYCTKLRLSIVKHQIKLSVVADYRLNHRIITHRICVQIRHFHFDIDVVPVQTLAEIRVRKPHLGFDAPYVQIARRSAFTYSIRQRRFKYNLAFFKPWGFHIGDIIIDYVVPDDSRLHRRVKYIYHRVKPVNHHITLPPRLIWNVFQTHNSIMYI